MARPGTGHIQGIAIATSTVARELGFGVPKVLVLQVQGDNGGIADASHSLRHKESWVATNWQ